VKKLFVLSYVFFAVVSIHSSPNALALSHGEATRTSLKNFVELSKRCHASAQATSDKESFEAFKKINRFYLEHRIAFEHIKELDEATAEELASKCTRVLADALASVKPKELNEEIEEEFITRGHAMAPLSSIDSTKLVRSPRKASSLPLDESMQLFSRAMPNLLSPTKTLTFLKRLILLSVIETSFFLIENNIKGKDKETNEQKQMPTLKERIQKLGDVDITSKNFMKLFGLGIARAVSVGMVNEYSPKGISSYIHRLTENLLPKLIAVLTAGALFYGRNGKLPRSFMYSAVMRIVNPFILGRGFLNKSHALYQPMRISSYLFPFFSGTSGQLMFKHADFSPTAWANVLIDGVSGAAIFNGVPYVAEQCIPRRMPLNPDHRRKAIKNSVRSMFDTFYSQWNEVAFKKA